MAPKKRSRADTAALPASSKRTKVSKADPNPVVISSDDEPAERAAVKSKGKGKAKATAAPTAAKVSSPEATKSKASAIRVHVPVDEHCDELKGSHHVYIDDDGVIWDAVLNLTEAKADQNSNKFYLIQLLTDGNGDFRTWTRWGRVGYKGQFAPLRKGTLADALTEYVKKFKAKTGISWENRLDAPKKGKYVFLERDYAPDASQNDDVADGNGDGDDEEDTFKMPESKLEEPVQELMKLIFNQSYMQETMAALDYDAAKLPLGKLSKRTILQAYSTLKELSALIIAPESSETRSDIEDASNMYFSLIPHDFGMVKAPTISTPQQLKKELDLLDSLGDMKIANDIMKDVKAGMPTVNQLDRQFAGLKLTELTPLSAQSTEYKELKNYLVGTRGATHAIQYGNVEIFRLQREGEFERFDKSKFAKVSKSDRRLLWHGSRTTNFGGILSTGLRIAPPEAPVNGYMYGKGLYSSDMSSKSANYCVAKHSGGEGLMLLCEVELGSPMLELIDFDYNANQTAKAKGAISTFGKGRVGPRKWKDAKSVHKSLKGIIMPDVSVAPTEEMVPGGGLIYNEFIAYDVEQARLRYLFRIGMK